MSLTDECRVKTALLELYTEENAEKFLGSPHPYFNNERPIDLIWDGRANEVLAAVRDMVEGVYT